MDKTSDSQIAFGFKEVTFVTLSLARRGPHTRVPKTASRVLQLPETHPARIVKVSTAIHPTPDL